MTTLPGGQEPIDPAISRTEDLAHTDVEGTLDQDPEAVPNADYSDPDTTPAVAPPDGS
jgi:hypothetical protein